MKPYADLNEKEQLFMARVLEAGRQEDVLPLVRYHLPMSQAMAARNEAMLLYRGSRSLEQMYEKLPRYPVLREIANLYFDEVIEDARD